MCGICGQFNFDDNIPVDLALVRRMTQTLIHRGPDDEGYFVSGPVGLGFRRLSIIDLAGGHQPMTDDRKRIWIAFNGEIYNFPELRRELESHGHVFRTRSDTEVIVYGYKQWGRKVLDRLNGMFGLAIWDACKRELILARDAMGIKPLYYTELRGRLYFASEVRAIIAALGRSPGADAAAAKLFLRYRYTPSPLTLFRGIKKLAPGTLLTADHQGTAVERWYRFLPRPFSPMKTPETAREELLSIYKRSIKRQLISDVPVGVLLSGGMDSGLLLGLMSSHGGDWPSFTVGYDNSYRDDELDDAAQTAALYNSPHTPVRLTREMFENSLTSVVGMVEEPVATSSIVPMYFVSKRAREDVKVSLIGQGPDELFGGYKRHLGVRYGALWRDIPSWARTPLKAGIKMLPRNEMLKRGIYALDIDHRLKRYQHVFSLLPGETVEGLFHDDVLPPGSNDSVPELWEEMQELMHETDELGGLQFIELRSSLPDELLLFGDKLSMAHGLEVRVPFLDREIVEYVERLNASFKVRLFSSKWLHRQVCRSFLPDTILKRKKRGFATNIVDQWFKNSMSKKFDGYFLDPSSRMFEILRAGPVKNLLDDHKSGRNDHYKILFSLVVLEEWLRAFAA